MYFHLFTLLQDDVEQIYIYLASLKPMTFALALNTTDTGIIIILLPSIRRPISDVINII